MEILDGRNPANQLIWRISSWELTYPLPGRGYASSNKEDIVFLNVGQHLLT